MYKYTYKEAIYLMLIFCFKQDGFRIEDVEENRVVKKFVEDGFVCFDENKLNVYKANDKGIQFLNEYKQEVSELFVDFIHGKMNTRCSYAECIDWFNETFNLNNQMFAKLMFGYIVRDLYQFGYSFLIGNTSVIFQTD